MYDRKNKTSHDQRTYESSMNIRTIKQTLTLFSLIIIEGYIVLSTELLTIRETIPYVGSGTDTLSIIIASILIPLAFGYHAGGTYKTRKNKKKIRSKLISNMCIAATFLFLGLSYLFMLEFFVLLSKIGIENNLIQIALFCTIFIATPTYLLGQSAPLIAHFFRNKNLPKTTGHILFFSTTGSFLGALLSTLVLMPFVGVHHTLTLNFVLMAISVIILSKDIKARPVIYMTLLTLTAMALNSNSLLTLIFPNIRINNQYNMVQAGPISDDRRIMRINFNPSSSYSDNKEKFYYINIAEKIAIEPILSSTPPRDILVLGAGGCTFGHDDTNNKYTYVDIDKDLKDIAEKHLLQEPIGKNKTFIAKPVRAFLHTSPQKFDLIYLDTFLGKGSIPEHLVTHEFFEQIKTRLSENGILMINTVATANFDSTFSQTLDNTIRSVFPYISRTSIGGHYNLWQKEGTSERQLSNLLYIYRHKNDYPTKSIYTDNKNTMLYDKPH